MGVCACDIMFANCSHDKREIETFLRRQETYFVPTFNDGNKQFTG